MADFPGDEELDAFLAATVTDEVRTQDAPYVLRRALSRRDGGDRAWDFVARRWDELLARLPSNSIDRMLEGIRTTTDATTAASIEAFLAEHPVPQAGPTIDQHRERMRASVALRAREGGALAAALGQPRE